MAVFELPLTPMVRTWLLFKRPVRPGDIVVRTTQVGGKKMKADAKITTVKEKYDPVHGGMIVAGNWWINYREAAEGAVKVSDGIRLSMSYRFKKG